MSLTLSSDFDSAGARAELRRRTLNVLGVVGFSTLLTASYSAVESVAFEYQGLRWNPPTAGYLTVTVVVLIVLGAVGPSETRRPSALMYWVMLFTITIPVMIFAYHGASVDAGAVLQVTLVMAASQGGRALGPARPVRPLRSLPNLSMSALANFLWAFRAAGILVVVTRPGFSWSFDIVDVYTRRLAARDAAPEFALTSYIIATLNAAVAPMAVVIAIAERRWRLFAVSIFALLSMFAFLGIKSALLTPVFLAAFLRVGRGRYSAAPMAIALVAGSLVALGWWQWNALGDPTVSETFTRRLIVSKGISTVQYWEAFRDAPYWFRDSGLVRLVGIVPIGAKSFVIGELYGFGAEENANANAWAAMFANIGYAGFALVTAAFAGLMVLLDRLWATAAPNVTRSYAGYVVFIFGEIALETSVLNGGVLAGMLLLIWYVAYKSTPVPTSTESSE